MALENVPGPLVILFFIVGGFVVVKKVYLYIQLLFSLFVLPGTNVRSLSTCNSIRS